MTCLRMWPLVALVLVIGTSAQQDCQCVPIYYCDSKEVPSSKCNDQEVCCAGGVTDDSPDYNVCGVKRPGREVTLVDKGDPPAPVQPSPSEPNYNVFGWKINAAADTKMGEFPWMAEITLRNAKTGVHEFLCGATIISPRLILTSAHNMKGLSKNDLMVNLGVWDITDSSQQYIRRSVSIMFIYPEMKTAPPQNDVAVLAMDAEVPWSQDAAPVCLPDAAVSLDTEKCIAIGWGKSQDGTQNKKLREVTIKLKEVSACQEALRKHPALGPSFSLHESFICGGGGDADTCEGDGGGPLMCPMKDTSPLRYVQIGITAFGIKNACYNDTYPGVYSKVEYALDWINARLAEYPDVNLKMSHNL